MAKLFFRQDGSSLNLFLAALAEKVNAVAGEISLPAGLRLEQIQTGNSLVSLWMDPPTLVDAKIVFSGIILGGYQGPAGQVLALILKPIQGQGRPLVIQLENARVLLHDGLGTETPVGTAPIIFRPADISAGPLVDDLPPEEFVPLISSDPAIFNGAKFLVFQAQDKQSGISHYEVCESDFKWFDCHWQKTDSPYLIINQNLNERIEVKAVDLAGNERVVTAFSPPRTFGDYLFWVILTAVIILCFIGLKKLFYRR